MTNDALIEHLAAIEHQRWADWQSYLHGLCTTNDDGSLTIPPGLVARWQRQIATPYADLSDGEKQSDRDQVDRYRPLIAPVDALNAVYAERDRLVAFTSKAYPAYLYHPTDAQPGWAWAVMILTPLGQMSWHIPDHELPWFDHLGRWEGDHYANLADWVKYDGHTTEEKYDRLLNLLPNIARLWFTKDGKYVWFWEGDIDTPIATVEQTDDEETDQ